MRVEVESLIRSMLSFALKAFQLPRDVIVYVFSSGLTGKKYLGLPLLLFPAILHKRD